MFQQSLDNNKNSCYPLLVSGNRTKTPTAPPGVGGASNKSIGVSSLSDGKHSNDSSIKTLIPPPMQLFGKDHSIGGPNNAPRVQPFVSSFNPDVIPRPVATLDKSPNFREFGIGGPPSMSGFNMGPSMRNTILIPPQSTTLAPSMGNVMNVSGNVPNLKQQPSITVNPIGSTEQCPKLHFCKKQIKEQTCAELHSEPEFRLNDKTKHPPNTLFNVSIKDVLTVTGYFLNDCEMFLRLDNGSQHGSPVGSCFFKAVNPTTNTAMSDSTNRLFRAKIDIPPSLNTKKGNTSSRVGFIEIHDSNNKMIAVSDKFWIRSRSRNQMVKDESTKKRIRMNQKSESNKQEKQVFHDYSPSSPQSPDNSYLNSADQLQQDSVEPPPKKGALLLQHAANPQSGAPSTTVQTSSVSRSGFNGESSTLTSFSTSLLQQQQQIANDFPSPNLNADFWNSRNLEHSSLSPGPSFSFLDREMSNASNSRPPTTSNLLTPSWNNQSEPLKTLENLVRNQQHRIEELSCLIANNAKLIHTLQMHVLSLTNPINSEP